MFSQWKINGGHTVIAAVMQQDRIFNYYPLNMRCTDARWENNRSI